ncbi:2'-5' RNA ligase family protein [Streptomyces sp. NPDC001093]|uniref:2'-5' RNA ligase family protein n=1 Tax=Streptomyces sp. NPDC001093 TaxID=3154376 RepID=UPI0033321C37
MEDFFARVEGRTHAWPPGRKDLHWLVIPPEAFAREHLYEPYRTLAEQPGLCPVAPEWMHITVLHAGPQDSASSLEVDQLVDEVAKRAAETDPFELTLSRPDVGTVAIESKGYPGAPHRHLWELAWAAQNTVVGDRWPRIPSISYPHLSHAYAGAEGHLADRSLLKVLLSDLPGGEVTMPVTTLTLVAEWHDRREIKWDVLAEVPLGGRG